MDNPHPQLPLNLSTKTYLDFRNFVEMGNEQVVHRLRRFMYKPQAGLYLWGGRETGKSHLLQASCQFWHEKGRSVFYVSGHELQSLAPSVLQELSDQQLVAVDDIGLIVGQREWEESLFHLFNKLRDQGHSLLLSAPCAPNHLQAEIPDLVSRLCSMEIYQVKPLSDPARVELLSKGAEQKGFALSPDVVSYILSRSDRSTTALLQVLGQIDHCSLQEKRVITIPFVKKVMGW